MDPAADATTDMAPLLDALERSLTSWQDDDGFAAAVTETVSRTGYAPADVERQLRHVVLRCRGATMRMVLEEELGGQPQLDETPRNVLVLASATVPGLVVEGIASALALGATALVRPSRDETVLHHLLGTMRVWEPQLAARIEVVGVGGTEPPWSRADAAIVYGSDETIALVRDRLEPDAARRVAGYGSRQGIAVLTAGADVDPSWAQRLADDVLTFRQRGCMSPRWLFVLGRSEQTAQLVDAVGRELAAARERHLAPGVDDRLAQRRATDADVLAAITAGMAPDASALYAGDAQLTVVPVADEPELAARVAALGPVLQTAVVATGREDRAGIAQLLLDAGCTRICLAGDAHLPDPLWPHDGIGRVAPLVAGAAAGST